VICLFRDYRAVAVITAQTSAPAPADATPDADSAPERAALAGTIDAQAHRMDQLSAAIVRATAQVAWSGRAAERFRTAAAERSRECLQLAVALRASAERVHAAAVAATATRPTAHGGHAGGGLGGEGLGREGLGREGLGREGLIGENSLGSRLGGDEPESGR
jgi:uncharacterized protein YukE